MRKIDRFDKYMEIKGLNDNKVTVQLGLSVGVLGKSRKDKRDLSDKVIEQILNFYTDLSRVWLLTGDGEMIQDLNKSDAIHSSDSGKVIRYWSDLSATGGGLESFNDISSEFVPLVIPDFRDCTDAVNVIGESMSPTYKNGSIIVIKEWTESFIEYGNAYLIITRNGNRMVKYIRPSKDEQHVICASENPDFAPFEVSKEDILRLYVVKGVISKIAM